MGNPTRSRSLRSVKSSSSTCIRLLFVQFPMYSMPCGYQLCFIVPNALAIHSHDISQAMLRPKFRKRSTERSKGRS